MRKLFSLILAAAMLLSLSACSQPEDHSAELELLRQENAELRSQVEQLQKTIEELEAGSVADWSLTGKPLTQGSGAEVSLTVTPTRYQEGQMVSFRVQLDGQSIASLYCDWDGSAYTASVELDAADGYTYSILLTEPNGSQDYRELNSPANPTYPELVNMYSSLSASCSLIVGDWQVTENSLTIHSGTAEIQLPSMTANGEKAACSGIFLVLQLDGQEVERKDLSLPQAEGSEISIPISETSFTIPEIGETSQLDLWLEVTLSDGQVLTHAGSSWFLYEGQLIQAVG